MKKRRFTEQQIIGFLKEAEAGVAVRHLCRKHGFSVLWLAVEVRRDAGCGSQAPTRARGGEREVEEASGRSTLGCRGAEGRLRGKTLAPQAKRQAVMKMRQELTISERRACGLVGLARTTLRRGRGRGAGYDLVEDSDHRSGACPETIRLSTYPRPAASRRRTGEPQECLSTVSGLRIGSAKGGRSPAPNSGMTAPTWGSYNTGGFFRLIVYPPSARLRPLAPVFPQPGTREPTAIRLSTGNCATIWVVPVRASAAPRRRTFWKRQTRRLVAQEALITQPLGSWARPRPLDNADGVPRLFDGSSQFGLHHTLTLDHWYCPGNQRRADSFVGQMPIGPQRRER